MAAQPLLAQLAFGLARAAGELLDHLLRQAGLQAGPGLGQQIDEQPLAGGHRIDLHLARERDADRGAVGIAPRGADIVGRAGIEAVDRDRDRLLERHHHDRTGDLDVGRHFLLEAEHQPRIAAVGGDLDLALDRLVGERAAAERRREREQHQRLQDGE